MAHWVPTARWVRHPRLRRGAKVSPFICRASRRRSITSLTLIQWVPSWSLGRLPLQLFALHASCRRSVLRDRLGEVPDGDVLVADHQADLALASVATHPPAKVSELGKIPGVFDVGRCRIAMHDDRLILHQCTTSFVVAPDALIVRQRAPNGPNRSAPLVSATSVVAGAGFEPATFGL